MKKMLIIIAIMVMTLTACQKESQTLSILAPNGIPSIAQSDLEFQDNIYEIERISGPQPLSAAFISQSHDVIIAPINLGANLYQKGSEYQLAGILTWSNLQVISRFPIQSLDDLQGQDIVAFGQGSIPEIILTHLFNQANLENPVQVSYSVSSVQESLLSFMQGSDYALVSEPVTSQVLGLDEDVYIFDLADVWVNQTGLNLFPQAGVFVKKNLDKDLINDYLSDLEEATNLAISNPQLIAEQCQTMDYPFDSQLIQTALPKSHIDFQLSDQANQAIQDMLNLIYEEKPELIGGQLPDDDWLYSPS